MPSCQFCGEPSPSGVERCPKCGAWIAPVVHVPEPTTQSPTPVASCGAANEMEQELLGLLKQAGKIAAIKRYRERTGVGLKQAKDFVEALGARHGVAPATGCAGALLIGLGLVLALAAVVRW